MQQAQQKRRAKQAPIDLHELGITTACIADTILQPLCDCAAQRDLFGYLGALDKVYEWAKAFYDRYYEATCDWEPFSESDANIYNAIAWDDFVIAYAQDCLRQFARDNGLTLPVNS